MNRQASRWHRWSDTGDQPETFSSGTTRAIPDATPAEADALPITKSIGKDPHKLTGALAGADRRWVELESARFIAANRDTLDDSHGLAVRAHNHAAARPRPSPGSAQQRSVKPSCAKVT